MITSIIAKLPMTDKNQTRHYYVQQLGFEDIGAADYPDYLLLAKDGAELHFFAFPTLATAQNYGQVYIRVQGIEGFYADLLSRNVAIHPNGPLQRKPWGQSEFSLVDPAGNLLTFGESAS